MRLPSNAVNVADASDIGSVIRKRRKELGYSQVQVSEFMGCSPRLIGEIERGRQTVGFQKVLDLARGLGIDLFAIPRG